MANRGHSEKCADSGHMGHGSKSLIIITTMLLLKATSHKTSFITLKRTIRASLNLIDPLTSDGANTGRKRNQIPRDGAFKGSNLLCHGKLPFRMNNSISIRSRLKNGQKTIARRRISIRGRTRPRTKTISRLRGGRRHARSRGHISRLIHNTSTTGIMKRKGGKRWNHWRWRRGMYR